MNGYSKVGGFSLVEMMVAVVISLIGTLVIFQVFAVSEGQKRTTVSGGDAQQNGAIGLYTIERDLRNAAHGMTDLIARGEPIFGWSNLTNAPRAPIMMRPVTISRGATSDAIDVNYSTFEGLTGPVKITSQLGWNPASVAPANTLQVASTAGFRAGNRVVVCPPFPDPLGPPPGPADTTCILAEVTGTGPLATQIRLDPPPTQFSVDSGPLEESRFNPANGFDEPTLVAALAADGKNLPAQYIAAAGNDEEAVVFNLGNAWVSRRYSVDSARLMVDDGGGAQEFTDGIVAIRAQYGIDTAPIDSLDNVVDQWVDPRAVPGDLARDNTPDHASFDLTSRTSIARSWRRVQAIRIAIVARSGVLEKTEVESRSSITLWANPAVNIAPAPEINIPVGDARRYRYKVFETIVPLRNMLWATHRVR